MPITDLTSPIKSENIASFSGDGKNTPASKLNYDVPLPGSYSFQRVVPLEFDTAWFKPESANVGQSLVDLGVAKKDDGGTITAIDEGQLSKLYRRALPAVQRPSRQAVARVGGDVLPLLKDATTGPDAGAPRLRARLDDAQAFSVLDRRMIVAEPDDVEINRRRTNSYLAALKAEQVQLATFVQARPMIRLPVAGIGQSVREVDVSLTDTGTPRFALVETWEMRFYFGDYGLGRTLNTFSLLPGERTTITVETWRTDASTREDSTSVFESSDTSAQSRFTTSLMNESGAAHQDQGGWALSVDTGASAGFNFIVDLSVDLNVGFAANHQEAAQEWSKNVNQSASEHANQVNSSRRQAVNSSSTGATESGKATTTVREIANTNLRRVLNFVYRELNQTYRTYVVLRDIKVAFYNGKLGSAEIVPLTELVRLVKKHVADTGNQETVVRNILSACAMRLDHQSSPVAVLEVGALTNGTSYDWKPAKLDENGMVVHKESPLTASTRWRFKPGALKRVEDQVQHKMDGLVTSVSEVVLRTDSVVVEALLGEADALDPYASALQALDLDARQADITWRKADTQRVTDALKIVADAGAGQKVDIWTKIFPDNPDIQVVPVAAVKNGGGD